MSRREFFQRALLLLGSVSAVEALLAACSPAVLPTTVPPTATASAPTAAATGAPAAQATAVQPAGSSTGAAPSAGALPGSVDPAAVDTSTVTYPSGDVKMSGYLARPKSGGTLPAVIVIHENRGLTDHIKDVTRRMANLGYNALGVDLLSRVGGTDKFAAPADPTQAINSLKQDDVNADLLASVAYLTSQSFVKPKIGVVGFCWGGGNSLLSAVISKDIAAAVVFYGRNPANLDDVQRIAGAVQGTYGELDQSITPGVPALDAAMKKYGKPFEYKIYPGANHAFFNDTGPRFNQGAAQDAWARLVEFYKKNLQI